MKKLLEEIFQTYHMDIYTYLYSLSHDASLSEDLTQEVFLEVVRSIATFRGESDIKTWLFTIARRKWFDHLRKKNRQLRTESIHEFYDSAGMSTTDPLDEHEISEAIDQILRSEPERTRLVVQLRLKGWSYFEIAAKLSISENSARVIWFRAKAKIRKALEQEGYRND